MVDIHSVEIKTLVEGIAAIKQEVHLTILDQTSEAVGAKIVQFIDEVVAEAEKRAASIPVSGRVGDKE
jgi:hypothetical protein